MEQIVLERYPLFIGGAWAEPREGRFFDVFCPADGKKISSCAEASAEDLDTAVLAAQQALPGWRALSPAQRSALLLAIADRIDKHAAHLAMVETLDAGKTIRETRSIDIPLAADHFRYFAGVLRAEEGQAVMLDENTLSIVLREPIGVVGQIVPWNFPFLMAAWKLAPALAAGCTVVFKPSSYTSLSVLELARLLSDLLPPGVFNVLTGSGSGVGNDMLYHPGFRKLAFTGSTEVGRGVALAAAERLIPATLELGGKSANIYFPDCQWDLAMDGLMRGILFNQGQVCSAGSRVFVHEDIYERFAEEAVRAFQKVKVGLPWEDSTMMGPQAYEGHLNSILRAVGQAQDEGAQLLCGGRRLTENGLDRGCFLAPTLLGQVSNRMQAAREEIFGPVAVLIPFREEEELIDMANDSDYGLGGAVWTRDINRALRVCRGIETGRMWVNTYNALPAGAPFGGYKSSGLGRETHKVILEHYTQQKNIMVNLSEHPSGLY